MTMLKRFASTVLTALILAGCGFVIWKGVEIFREASTGEFEQLAKEPAAEPEPEMMAAYSPREADSEFEDTPESHAIPAPEAAAPDWIDLNEDGLEALSAKDYERAVECFERCHSEVPDEHVFRANLAWALAGWAGATIDSDDDAERELALERMQRAVELLPDEQGLRERLARWRRAAEAEEDFLDDGSIHFHLTYDGDRSDLRAQAPWITTRLEQVYNEYRDLFGYDPVAPGQPRLRVVLYGRQKFDSVTGIGDWAGGVFDGTIRIPVKNAQRESKRLLRVLRHELLHAFVHKAGGNSVPGWLNEGLAQWLEEEFAGGRSAAATSSRQRLKGQELFTLEALQGSLASWSKADQIERAYAQSLALTAHIWNQYGERVVFEMVQGCKTGQSPSGTFQMAVGIPLETVLEDLMQEF